MTDLTELIERVRNASGPDRELDALIEVEARRLDAYRVGLDDNTRAHWKATIDGDVFDTGTSYAAPHVTASLDAIIALTEKRLPGVWYFIAKGRARPDEPLFAVRLIEEGDTDGENGLSEAEHETLPLALTLAFLLAIQENSRDQ